MLELRNNQAKEKRERNKDISFYNFILYWKGTFGTEKPNVISLDILNLSFFNE